MNLLYDLLVYFEYDHIEDFEPWWMTVNKTINRSRGVGQTKRHGQVWELMITVTLE